MKPQVLEPALIVLLGLPFHDITLEETLDYCDEAMEGTACRYLVTANVDFTAQAYADADLRRIVFFADRVLCDGMPLVWLSRVLGYALRERVAGSDMVPRLLEICARHGHSVYFFGSDLGTLEAAREIVEVRYPGLKVAGIDSPPMGAVVEWDNEALCERMRASGARLLLVCLGCPKQERWICAHHQETGIPLSIGVGASLDFITGKQKRAPRWMQKTGMEWFWRMSGSPSRLVSRYSKDLVFLVRAAIQQARSQRRRKVLGKVSRKESPPALLRESAVTRLVWHGDLERKWLSGSPLPERVTSPVLLDVSAVTFVDSAGLGQLAQLIRRCRAAEQLLVMVRPARVFQAAVSAVRMDALFPIVDSEAEALKYIARHQISGGQHRMAADGVVWVSFDRALDSLYYDEMMAILESAISNKNGTIQSLVVDLSEVGFIDSRAVGGLVRAWKSMTAMGGSLYLAGARPALREIIRLLKLDQILPEWKGGPPE